MTIRLMNVRDVPEAADLLYLLLQEREPHQNISHQQMPSWEEHVTFVTHYPYRAWYLIFENSLCVGSIYITRNNEIGVFIFREHRSKGYGRKAVVKMMDRFKVSLYSNGGAGRRTFLANIAPGNDASKKFFVGMGFRHLQDTYMLDVDPE